MSTIKCTNVATGYELVVCAHAFVGRFFPAAFSALRTARRKADGAFVLAQLDLEGSAPFVAPGGQEWLAEVL
jgi:hypothetical protein